jgi:phosphate starvation-inducible PhoH-like protein
MKKKLKLQGTFNNNDQTNQFPIRDTSPIIQQRSKYKGPLSVYNRPDLTAKQKELIDLALDNKTKLIFVSGPAGTSKSYLSVLIGLKLLEQKKISDIVYVRSIVESADQKIGYLPGEVNDKINVYMEPLYDKLNELITKNEIELLKKDQRLSTIPISFLRGLNWNAKYISCDESQNMTTKELTTLITRMGEHSKIMVIGDPEQSDINGKSGFIKMLNLFDDEESRQNGIFVFRFTEDDIVRSSLVQYIVKKLRKQS